MSLLEQLDHVFRTAGASACGDSSERLLLVEHFLQDAYSQTLEISHKEADLSALYSVWYEMDLLCKKIGHFGEEFLNSDNHLLAEKLITKAEEMGLVCRVRWKNIKTEMDFLDR